MLSDVVEEFLTDGRAGGWSARTVDQYRWHLERWLAWLAERGVVDVTQVTPAIVRQFGAELADQYQEATRRVSAITLRSFLRWCMREGLLPESDQTADKIKVPRPPRKAQRTIRVDEMRSLLQACDEPVRGLTAEQAKATRLRNGALILLLFDSLLRAHELCGLDVAHVDLEHQRVLVTGKGGKREWVRFNPDTASRLQEWLALREGYAACPALFVGITGNKPGTRLTTAGLRAILRKLGERAGVGGVSPHAFRRGGAVAALEAGGPSRLVQMHGRWEDIRMLETYTQRLETERMFDSFSPVGQLNGHTNGVKNPTR